MTPAQCIDAAKASLSRAREANETLRGALAEATVWLALADGNGKRKADESGEGE